MSVFVIDEIMGRGKTSAMINFVNQADKSRRFLFITPYLTEISRIEQCCPGRNFVDPDGKGGKLNNIKKLFAEGRDIVSTHALFKRFDAEAIELIRNAGYTLIMDEVTTVINNTALTTADAKIILENYANIQNDGQIKWTDDEYSGKFDSYKSFLEHKDTYRYSDEQWVALMPTELFTGFQDIYIMTYMFEHQIQRCYFDLMGITYERLYVAGNSADTYHLSESYEPTPPIDYGSLIKILDSRKLNQIGEGYNDLSKSWYIKNAFTPQMRQMKNNLYNFFRNYAKTPSGSNLWTVFCKDDHYNIDWPAMLSGKGYAEGFLSCNARGTNMYNNRVSAAYVINRFPNAVQKGFLARNGIHLDRDFFALSEMLQWIWRTAIRNGKAIYLYVPSSRMRNLLIDWIKTVNQGG